MFDTNQSQPLLDALLGTWTVWTDLHAGSYHVKAYFVVHFEMDPMRHYGCHLSSCSAMDGNICQMEARTNSKYRGACHSMEDTTSAWSDLSMFLKIGFAFHAGAPFWISRQVTTGDDWMGPYNLVWAAENSSTFISRYVKTLMTPFLRQRPVHEDLYAQDEFLAALGPDAVDNTLKKQVNWNWSTTDRPDPYQPFRSTCMAGNITPALPQFRIQMTHNTMDIQVDYALLLAPGPRAYGVMPWIARQINKNDLGFAITGPYCFGSDPKRAWLIDVSLHETMLLNASAPLETSSSNLHLTRGCVEGLPCFPSSWGNATTTTVTYTNTGYGLIWLVVVFMMGLILGRCGFRRYCCCKRRQARIEETEEAIGLDEPLLMPDDGEETDQRSSAVACPEEPRNGGDEDAVHNAAAEAEAV